jgi:hypothetical protein
LLQFTSFEINKKLGLREIDNLELIEWPAEAKNLGIYCKTHQKVEILGLFIHVKQVLDILIYITFYVYIFQPLVGIFIHCRP